MNIRAFGFFSVLLVIGGLLTVNYLPSFSTERNPIPTEPCQQPLTYRIGTIDSRFDITEQEVKQVMQSVESLWATALDRQLLQYQEDGDVAIHLVYSDEQKFTEQEKAFSERIKTKEGRIAVMRDDYQKMKRNFERLERDFQQTLTKFNNRASTFNGLVDQWEGRETPQKVLNRIQKMRQEIKQLKSKLDQKRENLELLRDKTNRKSQEINSLVDQMNRMVATYNQRYSVAKKFNQGRYIRHGENERINIFQFANKAQLMTVLAHEAGHAMGLDHVSNPKSVMHAIMQQQNIFDLSLSEEDIAALRNRCQKQQSS